MIETSEILDLTEVCPQRSNDDQHPRHGFTNSGIATPSSRQHSLTVSAHISLQNIEEMTPKDESDGMVCIPWFCRTVFDKMLILVVYLLFSDSLFYARLFGDSLLCVRLFSESLFYV